MIKTIIGIDPDLHKSGFCAVFENSIHFIATLTIWEVFVELNKTYLYIPKDKIQIYIEHPGLKPGIWHKGGKGAARNVGKCEAVALLIEQYCKELEIPYRMIPPAGYSQIFDNEETFKRTTGYKGKTSKDGRAAAAIAWTHK